MLKTLAVVCSVPKIYFVGHEVLRTCNLSCILGNFPLIVFNLLVAEAEMVVGWAKNHYLSSCLLPHMKGDRLYVPRER